MAVWSWVLYDFANTVFSISILSFFFPLWLADELGAGANVFNYVVAASMLLVALAAPFLGALADLRQRRKAYLIAFTLPAVALTAGMDLAGSVLAGVALFVAANFAYQSALVFYNALLPAVSGGRGAGRVSGYGVAAGYAGTIFALVLLNLFVTEPESMRSLLGLFGRWIEVEGAVNSNAFVPTASLYLLFSLPAFFFVPDPRVRSPRRVGPLDAYRGVVSTLRHARLYPGLGAFVLSTVLYSNAANTVVANMALYGREVFGMAQEDIRNLLLFSTVFAALGAALFGLLTDGLGPRRVLVLVLLSWLGAISLAALAAAPWMLLLAGPLVGVALGSTWVVSRVMLVALSPPDKVGEFFGFYGLAGKTSAILGPAITGLLLTVFADLGPGAFRIAVSAQALLVLAALLLLLRVPDVRPESVVERFSQGEGERRS